jgi:hypothetical protein
VTSPEATLKTVCRRPEDFFFSGSVGLRVVEGGGGGGTEKRARSCGSVSRMRDVMSWFERRALVKILGGGNLCQVSDWHRRKRVLLTVESQFPGRNSQFVRGAQR